MADVGDLHVTALEFLDAMVDALDTIPDTQPHLDGAPDRALVSPNTPVWDCCPQLAVWITSIDDMPTSPGNLNTGTRHRLAKVNTVVVTGEIVRCIPTGIQGTTGGYTPPSADELTDASEQLHADAWALWNHLFNAVAAGDLLTLCSNAVFEGLAPVIPSGGCGGWRVSVRARLDGYAESIGS